MMTNAALIAGVASLMLKFALASWAALWVLYFAEPRKSVAPCMMLLAGLCIAASLRGTLDAAASDDAVWIRGCWWSSVSLAALSFAFQLRRWLRTTPGEAHAELATSTVVKKSEQKTAKKPAKEKEIRRSLAALCPIDKLGITLASVAGLCVAFALLFGGNELSRLAGLTWFIASTHCLVATCLLGVTLACCIELTLLSSPDALAPATGLRVGWRRLANASLALAGIEFCVCLAVFAFPTNESGQEFQAQVLARLFAFTLLVISYIVWMVPNRIAQFQEKGKPTGWVSLTLAAWLGFLSLCVVCSLPGYWPWKNL